MRSLAALAVVLIAAGCQVERTPAPPSWDAISTTAVVDQSGPDAQTAAIDLQRFLESRTGLWTINEVAPLSGSQGSKEGRALYQMLAEVDLTVETGGNPRAEDLQNDPWLKRISGARGERKSAQLKLTWVRNGAAWKLRSVE